MNKITKLKEKEVASGYGGARPETESSSQSNDAIQKIATTFFVIVTIYMTYKSWQNCNTLNLEDADD
jgi:hypothetical protein